MELKTSISPNLQLTDGLKVGENYNQPINRNSTFIKEN